ncbi:hypothetical protein EZS27_010359 [termite gut metagenome]|uniref:SPOR domain-containing protein n=1 Tax=termite gut metagenome TaxID=433724 RepID=A0A5J4S730_9ZZZZ
MGELAHHIEILLLENECVVVPDFGGFMTYYAPARRVEVEKVFFPPLRIIGFNPKLKMNDGLLVQSYAKRHNVSFSNAGEIVKKEVEELVSCLREKGKVDFPNIGEIRCGLYNTFEFIPYDHKVATPYLFGLEPFEIKELSELDAKPKRKEQENSILSSFFRYTVATAAGLFFFLFFSPSVENTTIDEKNYAQLLCSDIFKRPYTNTPVIKPVEEEMKSDETVAEQKAPEPVKEEIREIKSVVTATHRPAILSKEKKTIVKKVRKYHILTSLAGNSQSVRKNILILKKDGFPDTRIIKVEGVECISVMSFPTIEDAYRKLLLLRRKKSCENAWIMPAQI